MQVMWLPFPMSSREKIARGAGGKKDIGHIAMSAATAAVVVSEMGTGAWALGRSFRVYSALSAGAFLTFGALTGLESRELAQGVRLHTWDWSSG